MPCPQPTKLDDRLGPIYLYDCEPVALTDPLEDLSGNGIDAVLTGGNVARVADATFHEFKGLSKPNGVYWEAAANALYQTATASISMIVRCKRNIATARFGFASVWRAVSGTNLEGPWSFSWVNAGRSVVAYGQGGGGGTSFGGNLGSILNPNWEAEIGGLAYINMTRAGATGPAVITVNRVSRTSSALVASTTGAADTLKIGQVFISGLISQVQTQAFEIYSVAGYNKVLTPAEVEAEYEYTLGGVYPELTP